MRILIIEDDIKLCKAMSVHLKSAGYLPDMCHRGEDGLYYALQNLYDVIILDRMLPECDGLSILQNLRRNRIQTPVIMVTALNELSDRLDGFESGADDYLCKPFAMEELLVRIKALLRRQPIQDEVSLLSYSNIRMDVAQKLLISDSRQCELSKKEAALLELFIRNREQILTRELLLQKVWGPESDACDSNLDNYISFLRRRLKSVGSQCRINTIHAIGYRLEA